MIKEGLRCRGCCLSQAHPFTKKGPFPTEREGLLGKGAPSKNRRQLPSMLFVSSDLHSLGARHKEC
jgi:hypothetical protein